MNIAHLTASPFFGGPERQMLGLALELPSDYRTSFICLQERGASQPFMDELRKHGICHLPLENNFPNFIGTVREIAWKLQYCQADVLLCHGYKPDILGYFAARQAGVPVVSVSRGWTAATAKVRSYEALDRLMLRFMDKVVCVSQGQADKVLRANVPINRVCVIRNAIRPERFAAPDPKYHKLLRDFFNKAPARVVCAAGRLSPEKGFKHLIEAASLMDESIGFVLFGEGPLREQVTQQIKQLGLSDRFILAGFRNDVDHFLPHADLLAMSSFSEGLPNVALEALAAGVPVVATTAGGTPEVVEDGVCGYIVSPGDSSALARRMLDALASEEKRGRMGRAGEARIRELFTFPSQSRQYQKLFHELCPVKGMKLAASMAALEAAGTRG